LEAKVEGRDSTGSVVPQDISRRGGELVWSQGGNDVFQSARRDTID
jgi:hypothetical protein